MKRVLTLVAWLLAFAALILSAAPAAIAQGDPPPPLEDPPPGGEAGFPGFPDMEDYGFPPEYEPSNPAIEYVEELGVSYNPETGLVYDPIGGIEFDILTGSALNYFTAEPLVPIPQDLLADVFWPLIDSFEPPVDRVDAPVDSPGPASPDTPSSPGEPTAPAEPASPSAVGVSDFEDTDPVLALYRSGFSAEDLEPFALDLDTLPVDAVDDSFQFLAYEIALLVEAGAFTRETAWFDTFVDLHAQFDFGDTPRNRLIPTFAAVDLEFARRSLLYRDAIDPVEDWSVGWAIAELDDAFYDMLGTGDRGFINGHEYAAALLRVMAGGPDIDLVSNGGAENVQLEAALAEAVTSLELQQDINDLLRADNDELRALLAEFSAPSVTAALAVLDGPAPAATSGSDDPTIWYVAAGGGAAILLAVAFVLLRRGRRSAAGRPNPSKIRDEAMATNQLLAGAKDEGEIVGILDRAGERQVGAPLVLFHALADGLRRAGEATIIVGSDLQRVVASGQQVATTLHDDPAFPGRDRAVLALPVIHGGRVQAVLAAHRDAAEPLGDAERSAMDPIAPALGGALERSAELGTMSKLAMVDGLTSLGNRRRLDGDLETTLATAVAGDAHLGFAMVDVDHFKTFNDTHGHTAGDEVLRRVAATIARSVRETDVVYRYGGEEFSMLLPNATADEVAAVAERVRAAVEAEAFPGEELQPGGRLTVSIGVATLASGESEDIRERADRALYRAKENGRNQVAYA